MTELENAARKGLSLFRCPIPQPLSEWADENFYLSSESSYIEGKWETVPFQRAPMNAISNDDIREITFLKSARVGYTKMVVCALGYFASHKHRNQCVWQPTDGDATDFCKDEIDTMLRDVPIVRDNFPAQGMKHKDNTLEKKVLLGSTINIRGGTSAKNYRRLSVDVVYYDELDGFDEDIDHEGSPTILGDKRTEGSAFRKSIRGSTPKLKNFSLIEKSANSSPYFFKYSVPCPHCDVEQFLVFGGKDMDHGLKWTDRNPQTAQYLCKHCHALFDNSYLPAISDKGRYIDEASMVWTKDGIAFYDDENHAIDTPPKVAFHIWSIYSPFTTWVQIVDDFLECGHDQNKLKTFINTTLGEPWEDKGEAVDSKELYGRREHYNAEVPKDVLVLTAGVDIQKDRIEVGIEGWGKNEVNWKIDYVIIRGDPAQSKIWQDLDDVLSKRFKHELGHTLPIACTAIDSGHFTQQVYKYVKTREMRRIYAVKGRSTPGSPVVNRPQKSNLGKVYLFTIGVDTAKEVIFARLTSPDKMVHFPVNVLFDQEYFAQLTGEQCVTKFLQGRPVRKWMKTRVRNEALDVAVYSLAALYILNPAMEKIAERLVPEPEHEPDNSTGLRVEDTKPNKRVQKRKKRDKRESYVNAGR